MISQLIEELCGLEDVCLHAGVSEAIVRRFEGHHDLMLPNDHKRTLLRSNGADIYAGYVRLFGLETAVGIDAIRWNHPDWWKFAWEDRCSDYWCFAETAWGDQYAYPVESLRAGKEPKVYLLDALSMTPELVAPSFSEFMAKEFVRSAKAPYDTMMIQAREKLGQLEGASHLVYTPSLLLGGIEEIGNVEKMNARAAMICNGDIATQLDAGHPNKTVRSVESYEDGMKRMRLRLVWA